MYSLLLAQSGGLIDISEATFWTAATLIVAAIIFVGALRLIATRYKRCPSNRVLVIYGGSAAATRRAASTAARRSSGR